MPKHIMPVVILCGGKGTRLQEKTASIPKPLVEIGPKPILWHIMKIYSAYGFHDFILCLGYKGELIKSYFENKKNLEAEVGERWNIRFLDTGEDTQTGGRIKKAAPFLKDKHFMVTYGDGVSDISIPDLVQFHLKHGRIGTVTAVHPPSQFGLLDIAQDSTVQAFREKPKMDDWINGGFFVFRKDFLNYVGDNDILEKKPLETLSEDKELKAYKHNSFWKCMDTYKDTVSLNELWSNAQAPWKIWR